MRPRDTARPSRLGLRANVGLAAGGGAILAAFGGLIAASSDGLGQFGGFAVACVGIAGAMLAGRSSRLTVEAAVESLEGALARELDRARRHRHPLTLIRIASSAARGNADVAGETDVRQVSAASPVRAADRLWADSDGLIALLPETDHDGAERAALRLLNSAGADGQIAIAIFPEDGLTRGALLAHLHAKRHPTALGARRQDVLAGGGADEADGEQGGGSTAIG